jgi:hypothetical protein
MKRLTSAVDRVSVQLYRRQNGPTMTTPLEELSTRSKHRASRTNCFNDANAPALASPRFRLDNNLDILAEPGQ